MRIVSLIPSATEILYALGLGDDLVGVTFECDEPASGSRQPRTTTTVVVGGLDTAGLGPREIDDLVRTRAAAGEDLYTLHTGALAGLDPELVLTQDLCRVCALPAGRVAEALDHLGCAAEVLTLDPHTLAEVLGTITAVGAATRVPDRAVALLASLRRRLDAVAAAVAGRPRPTVTVLEWVDPPYAAGHWVPDLVRAAGGEPVGAVAGGRSLPTDWQSVAADRADVVLVAPCGYDLAAAVAQAAVVREQLPHAALWAIDSGGLVVRPGPRLVDGVEALAAVLHPGVVLPPPPGRVAQVGGRQPSQRASAQSSQRPARASAR